MNNLVNTYGLLFCNITNISLLDLLNDKYEHQEELVGFAGTIRVCLEEIP